MSGRSKKNIVPVIVEGTTDATCLVNTFERLLNSSPELHELCMDGDLTLYQTHSLGYTGIASLPPLSAVRHVIQQRHKTFNDCKPGDLLAIVQIMDLDGAMIPDDRVLYGGDDLDYRADCIITPNVKGILKRNHDKTAVMRALGDSIAKPIRFGGCEVPYLPFYSSRNLEHALWNDPGDLSAADKTRRANRKEREFAADLDGFIDFINSDDVLHGYDNLQKSWDWPFEKCHSLERGSNIAFLPTALRRILEGKPVI